MDRNSLPGIRPPAISVPAPVIRLLRFWVYHRRTILAVSLVLALALFVAWLTPSARIGIVRGLLAHRALAGLLLFFSLLAVSLFWSAGQRLDAWIFMHFNLRGARPASMDRLMWGTTQLGTFFLAVLLAAIMAVLNLRRLAVEIILGTITLWLVVELIKAITDRSRPYIVIAGARVIGWRERGKSFPSGHTAQTFFLMSLMVLHFHPILAAALAFYGVAAFVGLTRMYVGAHYPRDVMAGAALGLMWSLWYVLIDPYLIGRHI